ncbi:histone H3.v1-like [Xiphophorus couchianus]|uniref:histone H3.v1-like n=1 Tax=Xiphophorus couchianus TaxID=32473 RepID=UPI00101680DD|nr:histone H3.v1-like [Xiphophorus couchianus]
MASSTPRQALISNLKKKLISLSRDQLQMIASLTDDGPIHNVDVLSAPELYNLIVHFIGSEQLSSLEDEGMTQLHLLDDLISDLLASNVGAAGDDPSTPLRTQDGSASQSGCPNLIYSDRESAPPDTDIPFQPTHTTSNVNTQSPAHLDSDTHTPMSQTDRDCSPSRLSTAATPAESPTERENDPQKQQDPPAPDSADKKSPSGSGNGNFFSKPAGKFFLAGSAVLGGIGAVALAPVVLGAVGFTSAGIAAGSYAASMMSAAAIANGGGVAAGGLVAILQSAGAVGLSAAASTAVAGVGAGVGAGIGATAGLLAGNTNKQEEVNEEGKENKDKEEKNDGQDKDKEEKNEGQNKDKEEKNEGEINDKEEKNDREEEKEEENEEEEESDREYKKKK